MKDGTGTITHPDSTKYEGQWKKNKKDGKGTLFMPNGDKFIGSFKNDYFHGKGIYTKQNGTKIEGNWEKGVRDGKFTIYLAAMRTITGNVRENGLIFQGKEQADLLLCPDLPNFDSTF